MFHMGLSMGAIQVRWVKSSSKEMRAHVIESADFTRAGTKRLQALFVPILLHFLLLSSQPWGNFSAVSDSK